MTDISSLLPPGLLQNLAVATRTAGALTLQMREGAHVSMVRKPDGSPVTEADRAAEAIIHEALEKLTPNYPVIAEEQAEDSRTAAADLAHTPFWLVDPLDGTRSYVKGRDDYSVNIALVIGGRPRVGLLYGPACDELYFTDGNTAFAELHGEPARPIKARTPPEEGIVVITSLNETTGVAEYLRDTPVQDHIMMSSALKFGRIAAGQADIYPRFGNTMEWDTAAGEAILVAAGGSVLDTKGKPLVYGKPGFLQDHFVARGRS